MGLLPENKIPGDEISKQKTFLGQVKMTFMLFYPSFLLKSGNSL